MKKQSVLYIIAFLIFISFICNDTKNENSVSRRKCENSNSIDSLIQIIINKPYIYYTVPEDNAGYFYLLSRTLKSDKKLLHGNYGLVKVDTNQTLLNNNIGTVLIDSCFFNSDTTSAKVVVAFYSLGKYRSTTTYLTFKYDFAICNWLTVDSTTRIH